MKELLNRKSLLEKRLSELRRDLLIYSKSDEYFKIKYHDNFFHNLKLYFDYEYQIKMINLKLNLLID